MCKYNTRLEVFFHFINDWLLQERQTTRDERLGVSKVIVLLMMMMTVMVMMMITFTLRLCTKKRMAMSPAEAFLHKKCGRWSDRQIDRQDTKK